MCISERESRLLSRRTKHYPSGYISRSPHSGTSLISSVPALMYCAPYSLGAIP